MIAPVFRFFLTLLFACQLTLQPAHAMGLPSDQQLFFATGSQYTNQSLNIANLSQASELIGIMSDHNLLLNVAENGATVPTLTAMMVGESLAELQNGGGQDLLALAANNPQAASSLLNAFAAQVDSYIRFSPSASHIGIPSALDAVVGAMPSNYQERAIIDYYQIRTGRTVSAEELDQLRESDRWGATLALGATAMVLYMEENLDLLPGSSPLIPGGKTQTAPKGGFATTRSEFSQRFPDDLFPSRAHADDAWRAYRNTSTDSRPIVMGRLPDTEAGEALGFQRLNAQNWSPEVNDAWVRGGVDARRDFYLGSNPNISNYRAEGVFDANGNFLGRGDFPETVFFREMRQLRDAGYRLDGDYMRPPSIQ